MHRMRSFMAKAGLTWFLAAALGGSNAARGDLIRPDAAQSFPDLAGDIVGTQVYTYSSGAPSGTFRIDNAPTLLATGPSLSSEAYVYDLSSGQRSQSLQLKLDPSGNLVSDAGNSYSVYGTVTLAGQTFSGLLLEGTPTQFGFLPYNPKSPTTSTFDLNLTLTGGLLKQIYGPDAYMRITTETNSSFTGTFAQSFSGSKVITNVRSYNSLAVTPIPEPSTFLVLLVCGAAGFGFRRCRWIERTELGERR